MAHSRYLSGLSPEEYENLKKDLLNAQNFTCYICRKAIDFEVEETDIDHIQPLKNGGKDNKSNFAITHSSCNRMKQDADLRVAQVLSTLSDIQNESKDKTATLADVLKYFGGSNKDIHYKIDNENFIYTVGDSISKIAEIFTDKLSGEKSVFIELPIECVYHDNLINPRGINTRIGGLIKEFQKGNPQLQVALARIDKDKVKIFDGQHKTAAQLLLGQRTVPVRLFIDPDVERLTTTNTNAGSRLKQVAFDKSIMHQLSNTLYGERISTYQQDHDMNPDEYNFSELALLDYFKGQADLRKYIIDAQKNQIIHSKDNKLTAYINFDGRKKELPLSYSTMDKAILSRFIDSKCILDTPLDFRLEEGENPRELEKEQIIRFLNLLADIVFVDKFDPEVGTYRIENSIVNKNDQHITNEHLRAFRISREEILLSLIPRILDWIKASLVMQKITVKNNIFMTRFPETTWANLKTFFENYAQLPLWTDRSMSLTIFAGKKNRDYWDSIFETGKTNDGAIVLQEPLSIMSMIM